jgi:Uma2 family endonuclease
VGVRPEILLRSDYTAEEAFWLNPPGSWELIDGRFVFMSPTGVRHGVLVTRIARILSELVEGNRLGFVLTADVGFILRRKPDAVRAPDIAFLRSQRLAAGLPSEFFEGAPDLAVEIMSPSDRWPDMERKAQEFLAAGTTAVWVLDPEQKTARVCDRTGVRLLGATDELACPSLLPGFVLRLTDIWA